MLSGRPFDGPLVTTLFLVGGSGPALAVLALRLTGRRSPRSARLRTAGAWVPVALVLGALPAVAAAFLPALLGGTGVGASAVASAVTASGGPLLFVLATFVSGPLSEEFGWRGYAQPRLRRRLSPTRTALLLGATWGIWHLPLFFLPGTWQESVGLFSLAGMMIVAGAIPLSAIAWFVSERLRGGVPAAVAMHAACNGAMSLFPPTSTSAGLVFMGTVLLLAAAVLVVGGRVGGRRVTD